MGLDRRFGPCSGHYLFSGLPGPVQRIFGLAYSTGSMISILSAGQGRIDSERLRQVADPLLVAPEGVTVAALGVVADTT